MPRPALLVKRILPGRVQDSADRLADLVHVDGVVRLLVEDRGGTVQAKSEPGKGSVFTVTFDGVGAKP